MILTFKITLDDSTKEQGFNLTAELLHEAIDTLIHHYRPKLFCPDVDVELVANPESEVCKHCLGPIDGTGYCEPCDHYQYGMDGGDVSCGCNQCVEDSNAKTDDMVDAEEVAGWDQPDEEDLVTTDHCMFYQNGKLVLHIKPDDDHKEALHQYMKKEAFYPNVWLEDDHGGYTLIDL